MWQPIIWEYFQLWTQLDLGWLTASLIFKSQERDNIVVQACQRNEIIKTVTMPGTNFGYGR